MDGKRKSKLADKNEVYAPVIVEENDLNINGTDEPESPAEPVIEEQKLEEPSINLR